MSKTKGGMDTAATGTDSQNTSTDFEVNGQQKDLTGGNTQKITYNIVVDKIPYIVTVEPFTFNEESRFYIQVNDGPEHVFAWDSELRTIRAIDEDASVLPDSLEEEISRKLQTQQNKSRAK